MSLWPWFAIGGGALLWLFKPKRDEPRRVSARTVLLIGDSLGVGLTSPLQVIFVDLRRSRGGKTPKLISDARGATNARQWRGWLPPIISAVRPDLVLVSLGTNDALGALRGEFSASMASMASSASAAGVRLVWLRPPNRTAALISATVESFSQPTAIPVALQPDGLHPTGRGYADWARQIALEFVV